MSEPTITLDDAPFAVREQVQALIPLVERLYGDSPVYVKNVEDSAGHVKERLTELGYASIPAAHRVALDAFDIFEGTRGHYAVPSPSHKLLDELMYDACHTFAVLAAALSGLAEHPDPCAVTWGMKETLLDPLMERAKSDEASQAADFVYKHPARTNEEAEALVRHFAEVREEKATVATDTTPEPEPDVGKIPTTPSKLSDTLDTFFSACMVLANHLAPFAAHTETIGEAGAAYLNGICYEHAGRANDAGGAVISNYPKAGSDAVVDLYTVVNLSAFLLKNADSDIDGYELYEVRELLIRTVNRAAEATRGLSGKGEAA
jgi:hypothetical protein